MERISHLTQLAIQLLNHKSFDSIQINNQYLISSQYYALFIHHLIFHQEYSFNSTEFYIGNESKLGQNADNLLSYIGLRFNYTLKRQDLSLPNIRIPSYLTNTPCVPKALLNQIRSKLLFKLDNANYEEAEVGTKGKTKPRFSKEVVGHLKEQFKRSAYPTDVEKKDLRLKTKLKLNQINIWFANQRVRNKLN
jgi:hypothetical protein